MAPWRHLHAGWVGLALAAPALLTLAAPAVAQSIPLSPVAQASGAAITHEQGIEFVTIGAAGNAAYTGGPQNDGNLALGRGRVDYQYRIGRFEVTTAQWVEFFNAAYDRPQSEWLPHLLPPDSGSWGGISTTPSVPGGRRWTFTASSGQLPTGDISWRMAAMYCNWLHNDKALTRDAFLSGAYDVSTFGYFGNIFTDQFERSPGARYFIPTLDEWIKAAHYDPNRFGEGQGGWWTYSTTSDSRPIYAPPQFSGAQANAGFRSANNIPLGAYQLTQSPWGLLDVAGATSEWSESVYTVQGMHFRMQDGSWRGGSIPFGIGPDAIFVTGTDFPSYGIADFGFRVAAVVPHPNSAVTLLCAAALLCRRRRR